MTAHKTTIREALVCRECEIHISTCDYCHEYFNKSENSENEIICIDYGEEHYHPECWGWEEKEKSKNESEITNDK